LPYAKDTKAYSLYLTGWPYHPGILLMFFLLGFFFKKKAGGGGSVLLRLQNYLLRRLMTRTLISKSKTLYFSESCVLSPCKAVPTLQPKCLLV